jgi:hypothetical protein
LKLYSSIAELPDAATAVQLLAVAAPQLPIDRLPAFLVAGREVCEGLARMPWLPGATAAAGLAAADAAGQGTGGRVRDVKDARYSTGYAWNNAWPMSSSSSSGGRVGGDCAVGLSAQEQIEMIIAAAAAGRDSAALQQMLAVLVQQLPLGLAQLAVDVLGSGVSDAALAAAIAVLQQRKQATAAGADADSVSLNGLDSEVVWQLGQSAVAAGEGTMNAAAAAVKRWGVKEHQDEAAAAAAAAAAEAGVAADQLLVREVLRLVEAISAAVPAGSFPMDAMQVGLLLNVTISNMVVIDIVCGATVDTRCRACVALNSVQRGCCLS